MTRYINFALLFTVVVLFTQCQNDGMLQNITPEATTSTRKSTPTAITVAPSASLYRGVYLDGLKKIVGDTLQENEMLEWCKRNNFTTVTCYDLYTLLAYKSGYAKMAAFIKKARTRYGVQTVTACMASANAFNTLIQNYNVSRNDTLEKFNYANLELEWWNGASTYDNYLTQLKGIRAWGNAQQTKIPTEEYMGWFKNPAGQDSLQAAGLVQNSDRILVHAYQTTPSFGYMKSRLMTIAKAAKAQKKVMPIVFLFNAEQDYSMTYFANTTFDQAYYDVLSQFEVANFDGKEYLKIVGYQIFAQSDARMARPLLLLQ